MDAQTPPVVSTEALQSALLGQDLLEAIAAGPWTKQAELATRSGRPVKNIGRELDQLARAGLVQDTALTDLGVAALDALHRALNTAGDAAAPANSVRVWTHADLTPNPDQPRREFDPLQLGELAQSILADGQVQNILARPNPQQPGPALQIVGGERRWRAIGLLIEKDQIPADYPVRVEVRDLTDAQVDSLALVENMQRANLSPLEEARAFQRLIRVHGWSTADIAEKINKDPRVVQLRLNLLELNGGLTAKEQVELTNGDLTITEALNRLRKRPAPLDLDDRQRLVIAELFQAAGASGTANYWDKPECDGPAAQAAIEAFQLSELLQVNGPSEITGRFHIRLKDPQWEVWTRIKHALPEVETAESRKALLLAIRARLFGADEAEARDSDGQMSIVWLNGPFDLTPEGKALADAFEARTEQARQDQARRDQERDAAHKAYRERIAQARANADAVTERLRAQPALSFDAKTDDDIVTALHQVGHPLPWIYRYQAHEGGGEIIDANGAEVTFDHGHDGAVLDIVKRLVMASVNAAAGLTPVIRAVANERQAAQPAGDTPSTDPQAEDFDGEREPTGEAEFWTWVQARLQRMHNLSPSQGPAWAAAARARLEAEGETFGDDSRAWTLSDAVEIADDYAEDAPSSAGDAQPQGVLAEAEA